MAGPGGRIGHAEVRIGDSPVMLADESPEMGAKSRRTIGGSPVMLYLYVEDVDAVVAQAVAAGGKLVRPVEDQFYGDRVGAVEDPSGGSDGAFGSPSYPTPDTRTRAFQRVDLPDL